MSDRSTQSMALLILASLLSGCAQIAFGPPVVTEKPLDTQRVAVPEPNGFIGSADLSGADLAVNAKPACDLIDQTTIQETTTREKKNLMKGADWWIGAGSVASFIGGGVFIVEGATSKGTPTAPTGTSTSSSTASPGTDIAGGAALIGLGGLLATIAIYDAIKSSGSEETVKVFKRRGEPIQRAIACPGIGPSSAPVTAHFTDKDVVNLGMLTGQSFHVDLDHTLPDHPFPRFLPVFVGATEVGKVNTSAIMKAREEREWAKLPRDACSNPTTPTSCGPVESYIVTYPDGAHLAEARALVEAAKPTLDKLAEAEAYKGLNLHGCLGRVAATHVPDPDMMESACGSLQGFLDTYPHGAHAAEVFDVQKTGHAQATAMRQRAMAQIAAQQRAAQAAQQRAQAAEEAKERAQREQYCNSRCLVGCSDHLNEGSCLAGCLGLCKSGQM